MDNPPNILLVEQPDIAGTYESHLYKIPDILVTRMDILPNGTTDFFNIGAVNILQTKLLIATFSFGRGRGIIKFVDTAKTFLRLRTPVLITSVMKTREQIDERFDNTDGIENLYFLQNKDPQMVYKMVECILRREESTEP
jgi:hypothetical protein